MLAMLHDIWRYFVGIIGILCLSVFFDWILITSPETQLIGGVTGNIWLDALCAAGIMIIGAFIGSLGGLIGMALCILITGFTCVAIFTSGSLALTGIVVTVASIYFIIVYCWPAILLVLVFLALYFCWWLLLVIAIITLLALVIMSLFQIYNDYQSRDAIAAIREKYNRL